MNAENVNSPKLLQMVDNALIMLKAVEAKANVEGSLDQYLMRDIEVASIALVTIKRELDDTRPARPKHQRTSLFTRYVIDEGPTMVLDEGLRDLIVEIESLYKKAG